MIFFLARVVPVALFVLLSGCATPGGNYRGQETAAADPLESINRPLYQVTDTIDRYTLKPIARGYEAVLPRFVRRGVTNFSQNLFVPRSALNNFLQGKPGRGFSDLLRFTVNSTVGLLGVFDVASSGGLAKYDETFSETFAVWGIPEGPYVYVPFLGPHTLLDAVSLPLDLMADPLYHYDNSSVRTKVYVLRLINLRAQLLSLDSLLEDSKDPYITIRESYLQNRRYAIYDGDPPAEEDEFFDEFFEEGATED